MPSYKITVECSTPDELADIVARLQGSAPLVHGVDYANPDRCRPAAKSVPVTPFGPLEPQPANTESSIPTEPGTLVTALPNSGGTLTVLEQSPVHAAPAAPAPVEPGGTATGRLDANGLPWDERIHASSKALNQDGTWRYRRNINKTDPGLIEKVEAELKGATPLEQAIEAAQVSAPAEPMPAAAPVTPTTAAVAPMSAPMSAPALPPVPTTSVDDDDPLAIPPHLQRFPGQPAAPAPTAAPVAPAPTTTPVAPVEQIGYPRVVDMLTRACKPGPNGEPARMDATGIAAFNTEVGITGIADLASDPAKVQIAYAKLVAMGVQ